MQLAVNQPLERALTRKKDWKTKFLRRLGETVNVTLSCDAVGKTRSAAYKARSRSDRFAELWDEAIDEACDALEAEARRRATGGVEEPVYYKGEVVGSGQAVRHTMKLSLARDDSTA